VLYLNDTKVLHRGGGSLEDDEHTGKSRSVRTELKIQEVATLVRANRSQTVDKITVAEVGISHRTCHKILSDDLNVSPVTQHSVPCVLTQVRRDDHMSICGNLIDDATKMGRFQPNFNRDETRCFLYD
jgi:hypothetical protein